MPFEVTGGNGKANRTKARRQQMDPVCITLRVRTELDPHQCNYSYRTAEEGEVEVRGRGGGPTNVSAQR